MSSWVVFARLEGLTFFVIARHGYESAEVPQWMVEVERSPFSLKRFLPSGKLAHLAVAKAIDRVLREAGEISEIKWHLRADYRSGVFDASADSPQSP